MGRKGLKRPADSVRYYGLENQGALCYLNSVLQVLFMTEDFRHSVQSPRSSRGTDNIDPQLRTLFDTLAKQTSHVSKELMKKLSVNTVSEQRDAAEFFEKILTHTSPEASKVFHGELTHRTRCSSCNTATDTDGHFWHLPLDITDSTNEHYSVVDGIKKYFQTTHFNGENQIYCEACDSKCDASIQCVIKYHPCVLTLLLKRFNFDVHQMTHVKSDHAVDIPLVLHVPQNKTYELYAVVDHLGNLRNGHYRALIKSPDDEKWYNFNDSCVTLLDFQLFQVDPTDRSSSAYLLFYRKKTLIGPEDDGAKRKRFYDNREHHEDKSDLGHQPADPNAKKPRSDYDEKGKHAETRERSAIKRDVKSTEFQHGRQSRNLKREEASCNEGAGRKGKQSRDSKHQKSSGFDHCGDLKNVDEQDNISKYMTSQGPYYRQERDQTRSAKTESKLSKHDRKVDPALESQGSHHREGRRAGRLEEDPRRRTLELQRHSSLNYGYQNHGQFPDVRRSVPRRRTYCERSQGQTRDQSLGSVVGPHVNDEKMLRNSQSTARTNQKQGPVDGGSKKQKDTTETVESQVQMKKKPHTKEQNVESLSRDFHSLNLNDQPSSENDGAIVPSRGEYRMKHQYIHSQKTGGWCFSFSSKKSCFTPNWWKNGKKSKSSRAKKSWWKIGKMSKRSQSKKCWWKIGKKSK